MTSQEAVSIDSAPTHQGEGNLAKAVRSGLFGLWHNPGPRFRLSLLFGLLVAAALLAIAYGQPRHGLDLTTDGGRIVVTDPIPQVATATVGGVLAAGKPIPLIVEDLTPEPDVLADYPTLDRFFDRQSVLAETLDDGGSLLIAARGGPRALALRRQPHIPFDCWQQIAIGLIGFAISAWICAIAPRRLPNILFGIAGAAMLGFTGSAAVYTTREIAIDGTLFWWLSSMNLVGASTFGVAMACLFLVYPRRIASDAVLIGIAAVFGLWTLAALVRLWPSPALGGHLAVTIQMALIAAGICAQVLATRGDPVGRAALRWIGTATLLGAGLFIATISAPIATGLAPLIDQRWAFGFFLIIHLGVAIGLRRERLFAIDSWALGLAFYGVIGIVFVTLDMSLALLLGSISSAAALTAIILLPLLYLPARDWITRRIVGRTDISRSLEEVARVALVPDARERDRLWQTTLQGAFAALEISVIPPCDHASIEDEGRALCVPGIDDGAAYRLMLAHRGSALFKPADRQLATRMVELASQVANDRRAYERGVDAERVRVARDLHDDLAARLMGGLELDDPARLRDTLRAALVEVRGIVNAMLAGPARLVDVLADSRTEAAERLEARGIALDWRPAPLPGTLDAEAAKALTSAIRELTTNVIRHSGASAMTVSVQVDDRMLHVRVADDGPTHGAQPVRIGNGLNNIVQRMRAVGGRGDHAFDHGGFRMTLALPVANVP